MKRISCEFLIQNAFRHHRGPPATPAEGASRSLKEGAAHVTVFTGNGVPCLRRGVVTTFHSQSWSQICRFRRSGRRSPVYERRKGDKASATLSPEAFTRQRRDDDASSRAPAILTERAVATRQASRWRCLLRNGLDPRRHQSCTCAARYSMFTLFTFIAFVSPLLLFPIVVLPFNCFFLSALLFLSEWPDS